MTLKVMMILPPNGRKYGFPKPYPQNLTYKYTLRHWLIDNGYPDEIIPQDGSLLVDTYEADAWPDNPGEHYAI